jgi:hypothetical protein
MLVLDSNFTHGHSGSTRPWNVGAGGWFIRSRLLCLPGLIPIGRMIFYPQKYLSWIIYPLNLHRLVHLGGTFNDIVTLLAGHLHMAVPSPVDQLRNYTPGLCVFMFSL